MRLFLLNFQFQTLKIKGGYDIRNQLEPYWQSENKTIMENGEEYKTTFENGLESTIPANNYCPYVPMTAATICILALIAYGWVQICLMLRYIFKDLRNDFEESALDYNYEIVSDEE